MLLLEPERRAAVVVRLVAAVHFRQPADVGRFNALDGPPVHAQAIVQIVLIEESGGIDEILPCTRRLHQRDVARAIVAEVIDRARDRPGVARSLPTRP
jgi:hypothetical protein